MIDPEREHDDDGDDVYIPDPDAPKTDAEKAALARKELRDVTILALSITAIATGAAFVLGKPSFAKGVFLGALAATANLRVLAKAAWGMLSGTGSGFGALWSFVVSFGILMLASVFVAFVKPDWVMGFGMGLVLPVVVGLAWGFARK